MITLEVLDNLIAVYRGVVVHEGEVLRKLASVFVKHGLRDLHVKQETFSYY